MHTFDEIVDRLRHMNRFVRDGEFQARIEIIRDNPVVTYVKVANEELIPEFIRAGVER